MIRLATDAAVSGAPPDEASLAQLRILQRLFTGAGAQPHPLSDSPILTWTLRAVVAASVGKALLHACALLIGYPIAPAAAPLPAVVHLVLFCGFALPAALMLVAGRRDRRAVHLGAFFLIVAIAFARESGRQLGADLAGAFWTPVRLLLTENLDAFLPFLLWLFAAAFPRTSRGSFTDSLTRIFIPLSIASAAVLTTVDVLHAVTIWPEPVRDLLDALSVVGRSNAYWGLTFALMLGALVVMLVRSRAAAGPERVRATWLTASLLAGFVPLLTEVIAEAMSIRFRSWAQSAAVRPFIGAVIFLPYVTIPASATYALVFKPVLELRLVVRRALRCAFTKHLFVAASLTPLAALIARAYVERHLTVLQLQQDPAMRILSFASVAGVVALVFTERMLRRIDILFFGPAYDAKAILADLSARLVRAADSTAMVQMLATEITRTLAPLKVTVDLHDALPASSVLCDVAATLRAPEIAVSDHLYRIVSRADAAWLARSGADLVVPLKAWDRTVLGLIGIAPRADEAPYSAEDREFLANAAAAAALALEKHRVRHGTRHAPRTRTPAAAFECPQCGLVMEAASLSRCATCAEPLEVSCVPRELHGKFRIERRLGQGGMGVVYLAFDVALRRYVAVKTLPYTSAMAAERLRTEARTMARLVHPNLAAVHGFEDWNGRPILIEEFLEGGTLSDRMVPAIGSVSQAVAWGLELCDGLNHLHNHGLLHGDIKPSNIGFDAADTAKFLDFGLTNAFEARPSARDDDDRPLPMRWGTLRYACPEAAHRPPCPQFDLWSLALVLYEAISGESGQPGLARPLALADIREYRADVPKELADVFRNALHREFDRRPRSALELSLWLNGARPVR